MSLERSQADGGLIRAELGGIKGVAEPDWVFMDLNNSFKRRMNSENLLNVQFNPKL